MSVYAGLDSLSVDPPSETWSYASVVGMMMYLSTNSRPDIAYAVHQCARFTHCPRRSHELGLKRIARYSKGTMDKWMIINPTKDLALDLYADADFAGLWASEDVKDPVSVKSRTGYVITLGGTPVLWSSKLQTEIALSTTESEYIACSQGMRALVPLRELMKEISDVFGVKRTEQSKVSTVFQDNNGALTLCNAEFPNMTPRTKHIGVKYHWFRSHLKRTGSEKAGIVAVRVDTLLQKADMFTKPLVRALFEIQRKMLMGW